MPCGGGISEPNWTGAGLVPMRRTRIEPAEGGPGLAASPCERRLRLRAPVGRFEEERAVRLVLGIEGKIQIPALRAICRVASINN